MKQLTSDGLNGMKIKQTILAADIRTPDRDTSPLESSMTGNWSIDIGEQPQDNVHCRLWGDSLRRPDGGDHSGKCL